MKKASIFITQLLLFAGIFTLQAQNKLFTADDYLNRELYPKSLSGLCWRGDLKAITYVEKENLIQKTALNPGKADTILTLTVLNSKLKNLKQDELKKFPLIKWLDNARFYYKDQGKIFLYDFGDSSLIKANESDKEGENVTH